MTLRIVLTTTTLPSVIFLKYKHLNLDLDYQPLLSSMPGIISQTQLTQRQMVKTASQPQGTMTGKLFNKAKRGAGGHLLPEIYLALKEDKNFRRGDGGWGI